MGQEKSTFAMVTSKGFLVTSELRPQSRVGRACVHLGKDELSVCKVLEGVSTSKEEDKNKANGCYL